MHSISPLASLQLSLVEQMTAAMCVSFLSTLLLTPLARWCAHKTGVVDRPDGARKLQRKPVALLGGVAVLAGLAITVLAATAAGAMDNSLESIAFVSVGLGLLCAVGVVDDAYNLPAGWKLLAQIGAAIPIVMAGCAIGEIGLFGLHVPLGPFGFLAALAWLVICTNAVNLIDGMDGLCSTVGLCVAAGVTAVSYFSGADNTVVCAAALAGSLAGFLIYNLPPARIYLGDAGSMVIGMTLALLTLRVAQNEAGVTHPLMMVALMALPLGDVALAMIRRKLKGQGIFQGDRGHVHHRLLDHGLKVRHALAVIAAICLSTAAIAVAMQHLGSDLLGTAALTTLVIVLVNRRLVGHYEWSLVRAILARRAVTSTAAEIEPAPTILRFDNEQTLSMHTHKPQVPAASPKRRAA